MPRMTGNRYFAEAVHAYGISHVFFVPTIMLPAMAEMGDLDIRRVVTHGEKAAAYMADGYARAAHRPGLCLFFFQAEDGIRDVAVTGVQTCALPISKINKRMVTETLYSRADSLTVQI